MFPIKNAILAKESIEEFVSVKLGKYSHDPLIQFATLKHLINFIPVIRELQNVQISWQTCDDIAMLISPESCYKTKLLVLFLENIASLHQTDPIPLDFMKDYSFPFLIGGMYKGHKFTDMCSKVIRSRAFYMYACIGDILDLKVVKITDLNYELLILHKHSIRYKLDDLNMIAILPKASTNILLKKDDYIRAGVTGFDPTLQLSVSVNKKDFEDLSIELGILRTINEACNKVSTNHKYYSHFLKTSPMLFDKNKWISEMKILGIDPFITSEINEQPKRSRQISKKMIPETFCNIKKEFKMNPSNAHSKERMAIALIKGAERYDKAQKVEKAVSCLKAAKYLLEDKESLFLAIKKKFSKRVLKAYSKV
ncbi:uncharacterized protein LOC129235200 isoform X2 [Uloborus diversus]|uniref:uncharacterized protein LOC129235200 isoform X2 n=1 Tax=Uloborus diversus TaxID=327109 RepID=UPI00240A22BA|nr:uncharacterized protein LOC129235200 isoform X2 [Uloborus diversus]